MAEGLRELAQDPKSNLTCVYCGELAATWDHVFNRVVKGEFSGYGHFMRNLVPCCRSCNERKGSKPWREFLDIVNPIDKEDRRRRLEKFIGEDSTRSIVAKEARQTGDAEIERFLEIRSQVFALLVEADHLAKIIRGNPKI